MIAQTLWTERPLYYNHLVCCMERVCDLITKRNDNTKICCPKFGSGLSGGNWEFVKLLIEDCWIKRGIKVKVFAI